MSNIGIIGFGNMGEALTAGLQEKNKDRNIGFIEIDPERKNAAVHTFNLRDFTDNIQEFFDFSDIVVIAVKPQNLDNLFSQIRGYTKDASVISIVAGKKISYFQHQLETNKIIRFMPNLAARYGKAVVGVSWSSKTIEDEFEQRAMEIAKALGVPMIIPEDLMPAITGLSGSGIAFVFSFIHSMALGGTKSGIAYDKSLKTVLRVMEGAIHTLIKTGEHPIQMLSNVSSPAGTTIEGICALEDGGFTAALIHAVEKATKRAKELET